MKLFVLAGASALLMLPSIDTAHADCHRDLKDMLDGTLEIANADERQFHISEQSDDGSCTLAALRFLQPDLSATLPDLRGHRLSI